MRYSASLDPQASRGLRCPLDFLVGVWRRMCGLAHAAAALPSRPAQVRLASRTARAASEHIRGILRAIVKRRRRNGAGHSQELYRDFFENAPAPCFVVDPSRGVVVECNQTAARFIGRPKKEIIGRNVPELYAPESRERAREVMRALAAGDEAALSQMKVTRFDGSVREVILTANAVRDERGQVVGTRSLWHDVTDERPAEKALRESESRYRDLVETSQDLIWRCDTQGRFTYLNPAWKRILGYDVEEMLGRSFTDFQTPEVAVRDAQQFARSLSGESDSAYESALLAKSGQEVHLVTSAGPLLDADGNIVGTQGMAHNITERKQAEEALSRALAESRQRAREMSAMLDGARAVLEHGEFKDAARVIFDSCKNLIGATAGYVALLSKDGTRNEILFLDSRRRPCAVDPSLPMPLRGLREKAYRTRKAVFANDFAHSQWAQFMPEGHVGLDNVLFAPLVIEGQALGLLGLSNKPGGFTEADGRMASAFGELAAVALLNSRVLQSLEDSEKRFRSVAQTAGEAIVCLDSRGEIIFWNDAAETVFGYSADEVVGRPLACIMPERFREAHRNGIRRVASTGESSIVGKTIETVGLRRDGREFPLELSLASWTTGEEVFFTGVIRDITERKEAEEALQKSEEKYRNLVETSQDLIWKCDAAGRFTYLNPAWERTHGYQLEEMLGRPFTDFVAPHMLESDFEEFTRHIQGASVAGYETAHVSKSGELIHLVFNATPLYDDEGRVIGTQGTAYDITDRRRAEEALKLSEERLQRLAENSPDIIFRIGVTPSGRMEYISPAVSAITGYTPDEFYADPDLVEKTVHPEDRDALLKMIEGGVIRERPLRWVRKDGAVVWIDGRYTPVYDRAGNMVKIEGIARDITRQVLAEEALRESEQKYRSIFENVQDVFYQTGPEGIVTEISPSVERFGYTREQLIGLPATDLTVDPKDREALADALLAEGRVIDKEIRFRARDGREHVLSVSAHTRRHADGTFAGFEGSLRDITERKRAEEELQRHRNHLAELVEERTAEVKAVNEELEAFVRSASHDLRAPLRTITNFSRALLEEQAGKLDEPGRDYLRRVHAASQRLSALLDHLLNLSRVAQLEMQPEAVDLSALATAAAAELQRRQPDRSVRFVIAPGLVATGDTELLRLALENLLDNAWKFTERQESARIEFGCREQAGESVYFVRDDGAGFDMAFADRLFTPFRRLHTEADFPGTGVGLATVKRIIHRHGGRVWAEGSPGQGATFYFTLRG